MTEVTIEERLRETSAVCLDAFISWEKDKKNVTASKVLHAAVHELRKVASRLEIELAASERDNGKQKQIKPPVHKTSNPEGNLDDEGHAPAVKKVSVQRRIRKPRAASSE